jgi:cyanophycinase
VPSIRPTSLLVGLASAAVAIAPAAVAVGSPAAAITVASTSTVGAVDGAQPKQRDGSPGTLVLIGGALDENAEIMRRIVKEADPDGPGGRSPHIALLTAAAAPAETAAEAADPEENNAAANGLYYGELFERFGATTYAVPIDTTRNAFAGDAYGPQGAHSRLVALQVRAADAVFLGGGDQTDYVRTLLDCRAAKNEAYRSCRSTRVLSAVRSVLRRDGVVAGISAGLTIMQGADMVTGGESYEGWRDGAQRGYFDDPTTLGYLPYGGFGLWKSSLLDSHFGTWGRQARMIRLAADTGHRRVVGVDETTALVLDRGSRRGEVIGRNGVSLLEVEGNGATWAYLTRGDRVDLRSGRILPAATSTPLVGTGSAPDPVADVWDSLAPKDPGTYSLVDLAVALVGSAGDTATGSTYEEDPPFTTVLTRVPGTDAWKTAGGTSFSGLQVDITTEQ